MPSSAPAPATPTPPSWALRRAVARRAVAAFVALTATLAPAPARAQDAPLALQRLTGPVRVDGVLDEAAWRDVDPLPLTQYAPLFRGEPTQRSEIRVAYDDEAFYAAGWFWDDQGAAGVRVNSLYRDRWNGDDAFALYIDAFNDNRNAKWFGTTPGGIRFDQLVSDDGATLNGSWDAHWDSRTRVTEDGWFAEVRIPFSTLGFQAEADRTVMGLTVTRLVSRLGERVTFPAIDPRFEFRQPSVARDVALEGIRASRPLYVTPYALTGVRRDRALDPEAAAWGHADERSAEMGVDARYAVTPELSLDVTVNTDFAQVEADDQQVNLDRFDLFFPEKRRFFQEGSGLFDFAGSGGSRLFHSRRIGLTAAGEPVPVVGGARLVGRAGAWDVGGLAMRTGDAAGLEGETFAVARLRRPVLNPYSAAGIIATSRTGGLADNQAVGADAVLRVVGDHYLTLRAAGTFTAGDTASLRERSQLQADWSRRVGRGLQYDLSLARVGSDFRPDLGYQPRRGFTAADAVGNWFIFTDGHPYFRRVFPGALAFTTWRDGGGIWSAQYAVWVQWDTKAGGGGWLEPKLFVEDVERPFVIGGEVEIPADRYTFADLQAVWFMPAGRRLRATVDARAGSYFDGTRAQVVVRPTWNVSPHLELGADWQVTRLRFDARDQGADIHVGRLRVNTALDARASGNAFLQYNSATDRLNLNVRLRYNFAEGTDLWLVYDEGMDTDRLEGDGVPREPWSTSRVLTLKYSHTLGF